MLQYNKGLQTKARGALFKIVKQMHSVVFVRASHLNLFILIATSIIGKGEKGDDHFF